MQNLKILNKKEIKKIIELLKKQFCFSGKLDFAFLQNNKGRLFIVNKEIGNISLEKLRINSMGMYFGEISHNEIRLSIEASQLIGKDSKKNILELNELEAKEWLAGVDIEINSEKRGYMLIKHKEDFLGCGKAVEKKILNFVPKNRRVN